MNTTLRFRVCSKLGRKVADQTLNEGAYTAFGIAYKFDIRDFFMFSQMVRKKARELGLFKVRRKAIKI